MGKLFQNFTVDGILIKGPVVNISGHRLRILSCIVWGFLYYWAMETPDKKPRIWLHHTSPVPQKIKLNINKIKKTSCSNVLYMTEFLDYINRLVLISVAEKNKWSHHFLKLLPRYRWRDQCPNRDIYGRAGKWVFIRV